MAVSGGYDSIVLLDLFSTLKSSYNLKLVIAHVNHCLRGKNADRDEEFVKNIAEKYGIKFFSEKVKVRQYAKINKLSIEEAARALRLNFLNSLRKKIGFDSIAFGHNADDGVETIIMNLIKGYGVRGLSGIKPISNSYYIHPLLFATKKEIITYAASKKLNHVEDETNQDRTYFRNKIRHDIIPLLTKKFGDQIIHTMYRSGKILAEIEEYIQYSTKSALPKVIVKESGNEIVLDINKFLDYFKAIQKSIIIHLLEKMYGKYSYNTITSVLELMEKGKSNKKVNIGKHGFIIRYANKIYFSLKEKSFGDVELYMGKWNIIQDANLKIKLTRVKKVDTIKHQDKFLEYIDYDRVELPLKIRSWIDGDAFIPLGMSGTKKLQDFFVDQGVVNFKRKRVPIISDRKKIIWIVGYRINEQVKITDKTEHILKLQVKKV